jgi:asparagine synthase (glutamine-hydrolysing)
MEVQRYWQLDFPSACADSPRRHLELEMEDYLEEMSALLIDAIRIRLRADVPVGAYLSGGLDSSLIAALVRNCTENHLHTFSIAFSDEHYDESIYQNQMARFLGTEHQAAYVTHADIGRVFPEVIWHVETPVMRTAPAPMFMLSKLVRDSGFKVVLTGEGADEFLAGYDIFKESKIRRFWAMQPDSTLRPLLLRRLYPDIAGLSESSSSLLKAFFGEGLTQLESPEYSHAVRWRKPLGETDDMALVGIISTQLLHHQFVINFNLPPPISDNDCVKVCYGPGAPNQESQHEVYQEYTCN